MEYGIGVVKVFDRTKKKGVLEQRGTETPRDVYFEASDEEARQLHEGQLVQFEVAEYTPLGPVGRNVLSLQKAT